MFLGSTTSSQVHDHIHATGPSNSTSSSHDCGLQGCRAEVSAHFHELEQLTGTKDQLRVVVQEKDCLGVNGYS